MRTPCSSLTWVVGLGLGLRLRLRLGLGLGLGLGLDPNPNPIPNPTQEEAEYYSEDPYYSDAGTLDEGFSGEAPSRATTGAVPSRAATALPGAAPG